jgi:hypothetical protein
MRSRVGTAIAALALAVAVTATPAAAASATTPATPEVNAVLVPGAAPAQWGGWSYPWGSGIPGPTGWATDPTAGAWGGSALWPSTAGPTMDSSTMGSPTMASPMMAGSTMGGPMMGTSLMGGQAWGGAPLSVGLGGGSRQWWGGWALPWVANFGVNWWGAPLYPPTWGGGVPPIGVGPGAVSVGVTGPATVVVGP